jgi:hypothetical protein
MGDRRKRALRVQFDGKLRLDFHGAKITSDAGLLPFRELDEAFRLTEAASAMFSDSRRGKNTQRTLLAMLRQAVYGRLAGYEDVNDAERLRVDPAMRRVVGGRANTKEAASTSEMSRFETEWLSSRENLTALMNLSGAWNDLVQDCVPLDKLILDMDSSESPTHGQQKGSAYNGYFGCTCYHPLFVFNQLGDLERAMLRRGNHASAKF